MTRSRVTDDPLRRRTRRELRLEARLRRSSATDTSALTGPRLKNPAKPPKIARELKADRRGSTVFDLEGRHLGYVGLKDAYLKNANLHGANLQGARNMTQDQLQSACGDGATILPDDFMRPKHWSRAVRA